MDCSRLFVNTAYVQVAREVRFDGRALTLVDLAPATVCLADGGAAAGHLPTGLFLDHWYDQLAGAAMRHVPAALSLLDVARVPASDSQVLLSLPRIREAGLEYQCEIVSGEIPPASGACVLFIGSPVAPVMSMRPVSTPAAEASGGGRAYVRGGGERIEIQGVD